MHLSHLLEPWGFVPALADPAPTWPGVEDLAAICLADEGVRLALEDCRRLVDLAHRAGLELPADPAALDPGPARTLAEAVLGAQACLAGTTLCRLTEEIHALSAAWEEAGHTGQDLLRYRYSTWTLLDGQLQRECEEMVRMAALEGRVGPPAAIPVRPPAPGTGALPDLETLVESSLEAARARAARERLEQAAEAVLATGPDPDDQAACQELLEAAWEHYRHEVLLDLHGRICQAEVGWLDQEGCILAFQAFRHQAHQRLAEELVVAENLAFLGQAADRQGQETRPGAQPAGETKAGQARGGVS